MGRPANGRPAARQGRTKAKRALTRPGGPPPESYEVPVAVVARCLGIAARQVQALVSSGVLPRPVRPGVYDLPACVKAWIVYVLEGRPRDDDEKAVRDLNRELLVTRLERERNALAEQRRELLPRDEVHRVWREACTILAGELDAAAARCASEFAGISDAAVIRRRFLEEERAARDSASKRIAGLGSTRDVQPGDPSAAQPDDGGVGGGEPPVAAG